MRYWGYLIAKLAAVSAVILLLRMGLVAILPHPQPGATIVEEPFVHNIGYTAAMMVFFTLSGGAIWYIIRDHRYLCRTCLRRLRMPITKGSWTNLLQFGRPQIEYICPYGHGTLKVDELQITGYSEPDWTPHDEDIWKELYALDETKH